MPPYKERFPEGSRIRIKPLPFLEEFQQSWKLHHPLTNEQLNFAATDDVVRGVGFYHGGDALYTLQRAPGMWHEECLADPVDFT